MFGKSQEYVSFKFENPELLDLGVHIVRTEQTLFDVDDHSQPDLSLCWILYLFG